MMAKKATESARAGGTCRCGSSGMMFLGMFVSSLVFAVVLIGGLYWLQTTKPEVKALEDSIESVQTELATLSSTVQSLKESVDGGIVAPELEPIPDIVTPLDTDESAATGDFGLTFSVDELEVGDAVGEYTVKSIKPYDSAAVLSEDNASVRFSEQLTLTGRYEYYDEDSLLAGQVCITDLDDTSAATVPTFTGRTAIVICFANVDVAQQLFGPQGSVGNATFTISGYTVNEYTAETSPVTDEATLVKATKLEDDEVEDSTID